MRRVYHGFYEDKIPSYPVISDPLAHFPWFGPVTPLPRSILPRIRGFQARGGGREGPANHAECQETAHMCSPLPLCLHLSSISTFRIGYKSEIISVILTFFAASSLSNILAHLFMRYIFQQDLFIGLLQFVRFI